MWPGPAHNGAAELNELQVVLYQSVKLAVAAEAPPRTGAIEQILRIMDRRAKYLGLYIADASAVYGSLIPVGVLGHPIFNTNPHAFRLQPDSLGDTMYVARCEHLAVVMIVASARYVSHVVPRGLSLGVRLSSDTILPLKLTGGNSAATSANPSTWSASGWLWM